MISQVRQSQIVIIRTRTRFGSRTRLFNRGTDHLRFLRRNGLSPCTRAQEPQDCPAKLRRGAAGVAAKLLGILWSAAGRAHDNFVLQRAISFSDHFASLNRHPHFVPSPPPAAVVLPPAPPPSPPAPPPPAPAPQPQLPFSGIGIFGCTLCLGPLLIPPTTISSSSITPSSQP